MSQAQKAPEPGMEDLLASIRKAINEDQPTRAGAGGSGMAGSMRDTRTRLDETARQSPDRPQSEIHELRNRIAGQMAERQQPPASRPGGFAGILSGHAGLPAPPPQPMVQGPNLRRGYAGIDADPATLEPPMDELHHEDDTAAAAMPHRRQVRRDRDREHESASQRRGMPSGQGMLSPDAEASAEAAFGRLAEALMNRAIGERSIEEITRELLRAMLKQWLDDHLPPLVERLVREEIERVARRGGR
jgi:cell pole-organizing protein PopZ